MNTQQARRDVVDGDDALAQLKARFGVDGAKLAEAIAVGLSIARSRESELDIIHTRGAARYNAAGRAAREVLLPAGYEIATQLPRILRSEAAAIDVALYFGDEGTGVREGTPRNAYAKGETMDDLVEANQSRLLNEPRSRKTLNRLTSRRTLATPANLLL